MCLGKMSWTNQARSSVQNDHRVLSATVVSTWLGWWSILWCKITIQQIKANLEGPCYSLVNHIKLESWQEIELLRWEDKEKVGPKMTLRKQAKIAKHQKRFLQQICSFCTCCCNNSNVWHFLLFLTGWWRFGCQPFVVVPASSIKQLVHVIREFCSYTEGQYRFQWWDNKLQTSIEKQ